MSDKKKVVFVCTHNAGKSRLAEAYLTKVAADRFHAMSAGTQPSDSANPVAIEAAAAADIQLRPGPGVGLSKEAVDGAEVIVTFGCGVDGLAPEAPVEDCELVDTEGLPLTNYDDIRDAITRRVDELIERLEQRD